MITSASASLDAYLARIDRALNELIPNAPELLHNSLYEAARYSLFSGGKRLRPLLTLATAETYGASIEQALHPACAIELIHTYSLIHDDLPCMDDDDLRRGKPTLHKVYSEGHAVLTGDFLLTFAFQVVSDAPSLTANQKLRLISSLTRSAGSKGMIGGQVIDLAFAERPITWEILKTMHLGKTASLMRAAIEFGGIIADVPAEELFLLGKAGERLGFAFQIRDDIVDNDAAAPSAVSLLGLDGAAEEAQRLLDSAHQIFSSLSVPAPLLHDLSRLLLTKPL